MAISVGVANPGTISSVGNANPGRITSVGNANPGRITGVDVAHPGTISGVNVAQPQGNVPGAPGFDPYTAALAILKNAQNASASREVYAPTPNFAAISSNATARANAAVNPVYTKYLNQFLEGQAKQQATQTAIKDMNVQNAQDMLKQTQDANKLTGERTTADASTKQGELAIATDWRQTDQGGQFDIDRVAQAVQQAKSGLTGSGVAGGAQKASQDKFNTTESRQNTQDLQQKAEIELAKSRTFEDLAKSNELATKTEGKQEKAAKFDLSTFIQNQGIALTDEQNRLELQRRGEVSRQEEAFTKEGFQDYFNKISNPAQKAAFAKAYGSYL